MKKIISIALAVLMILPIFTTMAFTSGEGSSGTDPVNIANTATITVQDAMDSASFNLDAVIDGDRTTGTYSPYGFQYSYSIKFDEQQLLTSVVLVCNGSGTVDGDESVGDVDTVVDNEFNNKKFKITFLNRGEVVIPQTVYDVSELEVLTIDLPNGGRPADQIVVTVENDPAEYPMGEEYRLFRNFMYEFETYARLGTALCDAVTQNIAADAIITVNRGEWWAWNPSALVDGDYHIGTESPKGAAIITFEYSEDHMISEVVLGCNGWGRCPASGTTISQENPQYNNSILQVILYNKEGEKVYDSDNLVVGAFDAFPLDTFVYASKVEVHMPSNTQSGDNYLWEIEINIENGNHVFTHIEEEDVNPSCYQQGYFMYACHCGKVKRDFVPPTGFHAYGEATVTTEPTDTSNGVKTKYCVLCNAEATEDIPATGSHNWSETVFPADCVNGGYTLHECTDDGCDLEYRSDVTEKLGHNWDNGTVTKQASITEEGEKKYECTRPGCDVTDTRSTRMLAYNDSTTDVEFAEVNGGSIVYKDITTPVVFINTEDQLYDPTNENSPPKLTADELFDGDRSTFWYGPTGSTVTINFTEERILTSGVLWGSGNSTLAKVTFYDAENNVTAEYVTAWTTFNNGHDRENPVKADFASTLDGGAKVKKIVLEITSAKNVWGTGANGDAFTLHELEFKAHDCEITEANYNDDVGDEGYVPATCGQDGSCIATCFVCLKNFNVTLPSQQYGHTVPDENIVAYEGQDATCSEDGLGSGECTVCHEIIENRVIKATSDHSITEEITFMPPTCLVGGIKQVVCVGCGKVSSSSPIPATGAHDFQRTVVAVPSYVAGGYDSILCTHCGTKEPGSEDIPAEMLEFPSELFAYVTTTTGAGADGYSKITLSYQMDLDLLDEIEEECDVRVIATVTNSQGAEQTIELYGKYSAQKNYNANTGVMSFSINTLSLTEQYTVELSLRLVNFRGLENEVIDERTVAFQAQ